MKYTNILFDLDGTLTDPKEGIINSVKFALAKMGVNENEIFPGIAELLESLKVANRKMFEKCEGNWTASILKNENFLCYSD